MKLALIAAGTRMPGWVNAGTEHYARRFPTDWPLKLREIPLTARPKGADIVRARDDEGARMLAAVPKGALIVCLDVDGRRMDTAQLAQRLEAWRRGGRDVALLIGGPDGLAPACRDQAEMRWSLSPLTLPHGLVRIVVAEALYRAWSLLQGHPYHRA